MALEAKRAAFNTAAIAYRAAWQDLIDGLTAGDIVYLMFSQEWPGKSASAVESLWPTDPNLQTRFRYEVPKSTGAGNTVSVRWAVPLELGYVPLGVMITNEAGEIA